MHKKLIGLVALLAMLLISVPAAFAGGSQESATTEDGREIVTFWYNNTGDEALVYEQVIADYNASQDKYEVQGLSVTDDQKLIVAMSSNEAPDVFKHSNSKVIQFQKNGLLQSVQDYIDAEGFDTSVYSVQSLEANTLDGKLWALPIDAYTIQMFYNKDLLEAAGYTEPPKTMEEMYEMAVAVTKLDANGNVEILGYPLFPYASARQELIYGFGGTWWDENGKPTPQDPGILESLNMNVKFRNEFGGSNLDSFIATANTNRYTEQDMFFQGKQLFRLDGSWLPTMMDNFGSTVNYGITFVPGTEAHPENRGRARFGRIESGYKADLAILDYRPPTPLKAENAASHFVWGMCAADVESTIVNGRLLYENRHFTCLDEERIFREARHAAERVWAAADRIKA